MLNDEFGLSPTGLPGLQQPVNWAHAYDGLV